MRVARIVAFGSAAFFTIVGVVYWFLSYEQAGSLLLVFLAGASALLGWYLGRRPVTAAGGPGDRADAGPDDAVGQDLGVFDAASIWPVVLAVGAMLLGTGAIFGSGVLLVGAIVTVLAVVGLVAQSGR